MAIGIAVAVLGALGALLSDSDVDMPPAQLSPRERVRDEALSQVGLGDAAPYWADVAPGLTNVHADWCGAFALWCLHRARLALDRSWQFGSGFLLTPQKLPTTAKPQIGDIAYFAHNEHHAVVVSVTPDAIGLVNGNGTAGLVSESTIHPSQATAFFSIEPLLSQVAA